MSAPTRRVSPFLIVIAAVAASRCCLALYDPLAAVGAFPHHVASHRFGTLETAVSTSNNTSVSAECERHYNAWLNLSTKCSATISPVVSIDVSNQTSIDVATSACQSNCLSEFVAFARTSLSEKCFSGSIAAFGSFYDVYCSKSKNSGQLCAVSMQKPSVDCSRATTEGACGKLEACLWNATTAKCVRNAVPTQSLLDSYCASGCVEKVVDVYKKFDLSLAIDVRMGIDAVCLKNGNDYCLPIWNELNSKLSTTVAGSSDKDRPKYCSNVSAFGCLRAYGSFAAAQTINAADKSLKNCIGESSAPSAATKQVCMTSYLSAVQIADKIVLGIDVACATSDGTANGRPCQPLYNNISQEPAVAACSKQLDRGNCSDSCDTLFASRMGELGCCGFFVLQIAAKPLPDDRRLPTTTGGASISFKDANATTTEPSDTFKACLKTKANATLFARCTIAEAKRPRKSMKINLAFAEVSKDAALFARVRLALRKDIAASLGISEDGIVNDGVSEDPSRQVTVKVTSSRQQATTTTEVKKNAAKYDFSIAGQDETSTSAAAAKFDAQSNAGNLLTTSTSSAVASCTSCTDTSGNVVVATSSALSRGLRIFAAVVVMAIWL